MSDFHGLWDGGYFEGDPLDPHSASSYPGDLSNMSILHATYLRCIKPYLNPMHNAIEIGSGRGAWTKCLLPFSTVTVLEVLSREETHIHDYLGYPNNLLYQVVENTDLSSLPDDFFHYVFSFGTFCHLPNDVLEAYAINLYPKLREGSNCFWMISDFIKAKIPYDLEEEHYYNGMWLNNELTRVVEMLRDTGYEVVDPDVGTCLRDPIIYFRR